ncbi:MAG: HAMP domain-containing histidine kinase [Verrucomicrobiaceae bacterium]|nr:MAG: HAMP domain-containing histidine kinase [Verrucomicrobiaceae bacterium]
MAVFPPPLRRFLLHALWVVVPFCLLAVLSWNAWRADSKIRESRLLDAAGREADRALEDGRNSLGAWSPIPVNGGISTPPAPDASKEADAVRERYKAGDFEGVLGSPDSVRSEAGLPLRSLAALQLLRKEADPARLAELAAILTGSMEFVSPLFLEAAEQRYAELKMTPPPAVAGWRERWSRAQVDEQLARLLEGRPEAKWMRLDGKAYLVETDSRSDKWRVNELLAVSKAVAKALGVEADRRLLADGLGISISVDGQEVAADGASVISLYQAGRGGWKSEVVVLNEETYRNTEVRTRNVITAVISVAGLAVVIGLVLAGRSYLRAVELARRQSEFMAAVSHEMRTPLAAMRLLAENLESGVADRSGQRAEHTRMIREESARLGDLVGNVLAFMREGGPEPHEAFDVAAMIADVASLIGPMAERRGIRFEMKVVEFPEPPSGDVGALRRAVINLLDNALKHTPDSRTISCHVQPAGGGMWTAEVSDSGPGVPVKERERIFEAFYRIGDELRRTTPGTGLGLALVKRTAEAHGGSIAVGDAPDGGALFTLTLPLHPPVKRP